jgi:hypothetical protein
MTRLQWNNMYLDVNPDTDKSTLQCLTDLIATQDRAAARFIAENCVWTFRYATNKKGSKPSPLPINPQEADRLLKLKLGEPACHNPVTVMLQYRCKSKVFIPSSVYAWCYSGGSTVAMPPEGREKLLTMARAHLISATSKDGVDNGAWKVVPMTPAPIADAGPSELDVAELDVAELEDPSLVNLDSLPGSPVPPSKKAKAAKKPAPPGSESLKGHPLDESHFCGFYMPQTAPQVEMSIILRFPWLLRQALHIV